jgi:phospholipase C
MNPQQKPDDPVKHVVLLMFENHSFDQMLGCFKQVYADLDGVDPQKPRVNQANGRELAQAETTERQMILDPHHEVNHVAVQMEDHNGGFIRDFVDSNQRVPQKELDQQCQFVMGYYPLDFLPALHRLAREFLICDRWYSSLPGPTWPNRFFALSGTSSGRVNMPEDGEHGADIEGWFQQDQTTLFDRLSEKSISWRIYFHDIPQSICLVHQRQPERVARYSPFEQFKQDAGDAEADFPAFCFIEPNYNGIDENDDHPPHDVMKAQKLLADVYNALRGNQELWASTLLVVLYDEHGGFYDHVEPPAAIPPDNHHEEYAFDQFGIRVPALLVSPWVDQGFDSTPFDHTSLLKYLIEKWGLGTLGNRTAQANDIGKLIQRNTPRTDTIGQITDIPPPNPDLDAESANYVSSHQKSLALLGRRLQLEMLKESPLAFAWVTYGLEVLLHGFFWLVRLGSQWWSRIAYKLAIWHWSDFHVRKKIQAIPILAGIIRDTSRSLNERHHAAQTLGLAVNQQFHKQADMVKAAEAWLRQAGH